MGLLLRYLGEGRQVSFKKEVGARVNDLVNIVVKFRKFMIDIWVTYDYVTEVFHVNKVCEWSLLQQMKVCFNVLKICYGVSMNKTDSFLATHILLIPQPLLIRNAFFDNLILSI